METSKRYSKVAAILFLVLVFGFTGVTFVYPERTFSENENRENTYDYMYCYEHAKAKGSDNVVEGRSEAVAYPNVTTVLVAGQILLSEDAKTSETLYKYNGIYWELPDSKVAEFSFQGAIMEAVGDSKVSEFIESLKNGENFLVIDAFDEAEVGYLAMHIERVLADHK